MTVAATGVQSLGLAATLVATEADRLPVRDFDALVVSDDSVGRDDRHVVTLSNAGT
jgi:hypothetical protein